MRTAVLRASLVAYTGLIVAPAAAVVPGPTWPLVVGGCLLGVAGGTVLTHRIDAVEWLSSVPRGLAGLVIPLAWVGVAVWTAGSLPELVLNPWFAGAVAILAWVLALTLAAQIREQERIDTATTLASFEARPPPETRRQLTIMVGALVAVTAVGTAVLFVVGSLDSLISTVGWLPGTLGVFVALLATRRTDDVTVTDSGVVYQETLHEWETFESVDVTDDAITLPRSDWYRSELQFDRDDIHDDEAVLDALSAHLPEG